MANPFVSDGLGRSFYRKTVAKIASLTTSALPSGELMVDETGGIYAGDGTTKYSALSRVARLFETKQTFTPDQFGAKNWITRSDFESGSIPGNDQTALQNMFDAARAVGGTIWFPYNRVYGAFNLSADWSADAVQAASGRPYGLQGIRIEGHGSRIQQLSGADFTKPFLLVQGHINASAGPGSNNKVTRLVVQDLELVGLYSAGINGTPAQTGAADGMLVRSVQHVDIIRLTTRNFYRHGFVLRRQYFGTDGDEYTYNVKLDHIRSVGNGGAGILLGDSTGAAVTVIGIGLDATANRLGGITTCSCNSVFVGGHVVGNGNFGWQTVPTKQTVSGNENISTSAGNVFLGTRSEQTSGWAEFDIRAGAGTQLMGVTVLATAGATGVLLGGSNTGIAGGSVPKPVLFGGYISGNGSSGSPGQVAVAAQPTMYTGAAVSSGAGSTATLSSPVPLNISSGAVLTARWYSGGALSTATFTTSAAYTYDPSVRASASLSGTASAAIPSGALLTIAGTDATSPTVDATRTDYTNFAGSRSVPETMYLGTFAVYDAGATPFPTREGAQRFPRTLATLGAGTPPSGVMFQYTKLNASGRPQLVATFNDGLEHFIAEQADTANGFTAMPRESAAAMGTTPFYPAAGTFSQGHYIKNTTPAETGTSPNKYVLKGMVCIAGGNPPAQNAAGWVQDRGFTGN